MRQIWHKSQFNIYKIAIQILQSSWRTCLKGQFNSIGFLLIVNWLYLKYRNLQVSIFRDYADKNFANYRYRKKRWILIQWKNIFFNNWYRYTLFSLPKITGILKIYIFAWNFAETFLYWYIKGQSQKRKFGNNPKMQISKSKNPKIQNQIMNIAIRR